MPTISPKDLGKIALNLSKKKGTTSTSRLLKAGIKKFGSKGKFLNALFKGTKAATKLSKSVNTGVVIDTKKTTKFAKDTAKALREKHKKKLKRKKVKVKSGKLLKSLKAKILSKKEKK